jgi:enoyl-[acyl-carrier protein] reductase I
VGLLSGKSALVFGVSNDHSIAWGIAQAFAREGATLGFGYTIPDVEKYVRPLAESVDSKFTEYCDVGSDEAIAATMERAHAALGDIDILIHAIAFANREELNGPYYQTSRAGFQLAMDVSVYSFTALARAALPVMRAGGSLLTLTYLGGQRVVQNYNVMGLAKAALDASVRYLANDLGAHEKHLRVNAISAGPIRTRASRGIADFSKMHAEFAGVAPLRRNVTIEDVGGAALYLCSDLASGVTGEIHYVDAGYNIIGSGDPDKS